MSVTPPGGGRKESVPSTRARFCLVALTCAAFALSACARIRDSAPASAGCDAPRAQQLQTEGYRWLAQGQWYQAHLAAHALVAIGIACDQPAIAAPATVHGDYILAVVMHQRHDDRQSTYWLNSGEAVLQRVKQHESDAPDLQGLYDEMQPKYLALHDELPQ